MRYDFGKVYKEIRESKGLTQEEACGGCSLKNQPIKNRKWQDNP